GDTDRTEDTDRYGFIRIGLIRIDPCPLFDPCPRLRNDGGATARSETRQRLLLLHRRVVVHRRDRRILYLGQVHGRVLAADLDLEVALEFELRDRRLESALGGVELDEADGVAALELGALDLERQAA